MEEGQEIKKDNLSALSDELRTLEKEQTESVNWNSEKAQRLVELRAKFPTETPKKDKDIHFSKFPSPGIKSYSKKR